MSPGFGSAFVRSVALHAIVVGAIGAWLGHEGMLAKGGAGLSGDPRARLAMVGTIEAWPEPRKEAPPPPAAREGLEVPREETKLPSEVKNPHPRVEEEANVASSEKSGGSAAEGPAKAEGDGGRGDVAAGIGNGDRSNYLAEVYRRIQRQIGSPGFLAHDYRCVLQLEVARDGTVKKITVLKPSGDPTLDHRAITAVERAQPFPTFPEDLRVEVPVIFHSVDSRS